VLRRRRAALGRGRGRRWSRGGGAVRGEAALGRGVGGGGAPLTGPTVARPDR